MIGSEYDMVCVECNGKTTMITTISNPDRTLKTYMCVRCKDKIAQEYAEWKIRNPGSMMLPYAVAKNRIDSLEKAVTQLRESLKNSLELCVFCESIADLHWSNDYDDSMSVCKKCHEKKNLYDKESYYSIQESQRKLLEDTAYLKRKV